MTSHIPVHFSSCDSPTKNSSYSNASEGLGKSSQSLQVIGGITFSRTQRGGDLLMINGFSYMLNKQSRMQYYWRYETRSCYATLITTKCVITNKHSVCSTGKTIILMLLQLLDKKFECFENTLRTALVKR